MSKYQNGFVSFLVLLVVGTFLFLGFFFYFGTPNYLSERLQSNKSEDTAGDVLAVVSAPLLASNSHPNYWAAGANKWTAKKYTLVPGSRNDGYPINWVWSGQNDIYRILIYQYYTIDPVSKEEVPGPYREYEIWEGSINNPAYVHTYGGPTPQATRPIYSNHSDCTTNTNRKVQWPDIPANNNYGMVKVSEKINGNCTIPYDSSQNKGGYFAVKVLETWDDPATREGKCNAYIPAALSEITNRICKSAPYVGIVQQRYVQGYVPSVSSTNYHGCEMTIYAWGYNYASTSYYRNWFRNGELRFSNYKGIGAFSNSVNPNDDAWWNSKCIGPNAPNGNVWESVPNWYYSGTYKLTNTVYRDIGY